MKPEPIIATGRHVFLGTLSFTVCFVAWGLISAFAPRFREIFHLTATETGILVAIPVLLGSLGRIPMGMLTDRYGGRAVFATLMIFLLFPLLLIPRATSYNRLLWLGLFLGMAGSSFAVGVGYLSRWTPASKQGSVLGVYGLGNIGQSAAVFLGPAVATWIGWEGVFRGTAGMVLAWAIVFAVMARNAPAPAPPKSFGQMVQTLARQPLSWAVSSFYFLTFGGFVAFSIYLPTLLRDQFGLTPIDAGFRTAGFVVVATALRPLGGWLADQIGGARVLSAVFAAVIPFAMLLAWPAMIPFTVGALGCAALLGLGNGAVFKLVPQYFPHDTGTVTGLVGATGGLGGFFPPLVLGVFRDSLGAIWPGFVLLAGTSAALWAVNRALFIPRQEEEDLALPPELTRAADQLRAGAWATVWTGLLLAAIVVGSRNLQNFDAALVIYTFAIIFATWGATYHYCVWLQKPPTKVYWRRGWQLFRERGALRSLATVSRVVLTHIAAQTFIKHRSQLRWWMHLCLSWGCALAAAITFPLVFGWIHFGTLPDEQMTYVTYLFGFPVLSFRVRTVLSWLLFHGLDIAAVLVLAGIALSLWRRMLDKGAQAMQSLSMDFLPLILLFAISVTGLALTASTLWLRGQFYGFLSILHAITVIAALLYLPFGKFFHIFQRPAQLGVKLYQQAGEEGEGAFCARCGERFTSRMQLEDLKAVLPQLGFDYTLAGPARSWQGLCPACKRKSLASAQLRLIEESHGETAGNG
ncbi:MAG: MFS transporter [Terriglobia bacterium]